MGDEILIFGADKRVPIGREVPIASGSARTSWFTNAPRDAVMTESPQRREERDT